MTEPQRKQVEKRIIARLHDDASLPLYMRKLFCEAIANCDLTEEVIEVYSLCNQWLNIDSFLKYEALSLTEDQLQDLLDRQMSLEQEGALIFDPSINLYHGY